MNTISSCRNSTTTDPALVVLPGAIGDKQTNEYDGTVEHFIDDPYPGCPDDAR